MSRSIFFAVSLLGAACGGGEGSGGEGSGGEGSGGEGTSGGSEGGGPAVCGDGVVAGDEACDDGADNGMGGKCDEDCSGLRVATVEGDAIPFDKGPDGRVEGATVTILEFPELEFVTGADGHFKFEGLPVGADVTLVMAHPDFVPIQTGTHVLPEEGLTRLTFQAVSHDIYDVFGAVVMIEPDASKCQMVTTVTRVGKSIYDPGAHGEDAVVVTLDPPLAAENGPIYFNAQVIPEPGLVETSEDGGVLFVQVPPGEYRWTASKAGATFREVRMKCRAGFLVNASPPWGLQRL